MHEDTHTLCVNDAVDFDHDTHTDAKTPIYSICIYVSM
jgi:hypothetical protein